MYLPSLTFLVALEETNLDLSIPICWLLYDLKHFLLNSVPALSLSVWMGCMVRVCVCVQNNSKKFDQSSSFWLEETLLKTSGRRKGGRVVVVGEGGNFLGERAKDTSRKYMGSPTTPSDVTL